MKHSIHSDILTVVINEKGAELNSIKSNKSQKEYLWQGNPDVWDQQAPILFPIVGRLKDGKYTYDGKSYKLPIHGFAADSLFTTDGADENGNSIIFTLKSSTETLKIYPFDFIFRVIFKLNQNTLETTYQVENKSDGPMYFSCGSHEGYNVPWNQGESFDDYYLEFEKDADYQSLLVSENGLLLDSTFEVVKGWHLPLSYELFKDNDSLAFAKVPSSRVTLGSNKNSTKIIVDYKNTPNLVLWTRQNAAYLCIEPWDGLPDYEATDGDFSKKPGNVCLQKGETYNMTHSIIIEE